MDITKMTVEEVMKACAEGKFSIREAFTRSEGSQLFVTSLNKLLLRGYDSTPKNHLAVANLVNITSKDIKFPLLYGVSPTLIPEGSEIPYSEISPTAVTVEPLKFGMRMGFTNEMLDDNEVGLMAWNTERMGARMAELEAAETFKCLETFYASGLTGDIGPYYRGSKYTTYSGTNTVSNIQIDMSAVTLNTWEEAISEAIARLASQTLTVGSRTIDYPVVADTIIVNPKQLIPVRRVLDAQIAQARGNLRLIDTGAIAIGGGSNVMRGMLNIIATPYITTNHAFIGKAQGGGLVFVRRAPLAIDKTENFATDCTDARALERFLPAVVDYRQFAYCFDINDMG